MAKLLRVRMQGLEEVNEKMLELADDLSGKPFRDAMFQAAFIVERGAKKNAPVDTGKLRASISSDVEGRGARIQGVIGSRVKYAPFMEEGTVAHWPPRDALEVWAARHGIPVFLVMRSIAQKGLKGRRFLGRSLEDNKDAIVAIIGDFVGAVTRKASG